MCIYVAQWQCAYRDCRSVTSPGIKQRLPHFGRPSTRWSIAGIGEWCEAIVFGLVHNSTSTCTQQEADGSLLVIECSLVEWCEAHVGSLVDPRSSPVPTPQPTPTRPSCHLLLPCAHPPATSPQQRFPVTLSQHSMGYLHGRLLLLHGEGHSMQVISESCIQSNHSSVNPSILQQQSVCYYLAEFCELAHGLGNRLQLIPAYN